MSLSTCGLLFSVRHPIVNNYHFHKYPTSQNEHIPVSPTEGIFILYIPLVKLLISCIQRLFMALSYLAFCGHYVGPSFAKIDQMINVKEMCEL